MGKFEKKWEELKTDSQLDFSFLQEALAKYQVRACRGRAFERRCLAARRRCQVPSDGATVS